ncbi:MAG: hypothetical protein DWQ36_09650 [Acidobacteria bacterium]|nr:MAG: hypothetical protein DWQ30_00930 [Acidobacteriota bacterium]REK08325.1 MAG: hypothetical protein DWQ36_09650 [Acidobacteriota bacterium]
MSKNEEFGALAAAPRRAVRLALSALLLSAATAAAAASPITLELVDAPADEVLSALAAVLDAELEMPPHGDRDVTVTLHGVQATTALQVVCESIGCDWTLGGGRLSIAWQERGGSAPSVQSAETGAAALQDEPRFGEELDLSLRDARLGEVLAGFAKVTGVPVDVAAELENATVTVELRQVPAWKALEQICRVNGCRLELLDAAKRLRVSPR